jgi:sialic acid synthase SpsE
MLMKREVLKIGEKEVGGESLFFTIEEAMANLGNFDKALRMIDAAATTGADAVEFQLVIAKDMYISSHPGYDFCAKCEFTTSQIGDVVAYTKNWGLEFLAVPLSPILVEPLVKAGCSGFNINASDINNPEIIDTVAESGLPFFLSTLLATEEEIDWAVNRIRKKATSSFSILHGQHTMMSSGSGVNAAQTALGYISTLKNRYDVPVGFIDHTPYVWMAAVAVAAGADAVSKHLALSRSDKGPDWQVCLEPDEMTQAVRWARGIRESMNPKHKKLAAGEDLDRGKMRRSIVAARPLRAGKAIEREDISFKRPGTGIEPAKYGDVIGKIVTCDVAEDGLIPIGILKEV